MTLQKRPERYARQDLGHLMVRPEDLNDVIGLMERVMPGDATSDPDVQPHVKIRVGDYEMTDVADLQKLPADAQGKPVTLERLLDVPTGFQVTLGKYVAYVETGPNPNDQARALLQDVAARLSACRSRWAALRTEAFLYFAYLTSATIMAGGVVLGIAVGSWFVAALGVIGGLLLANLGRGGQEPNGAYLARRSSREVQSQRFDVWHNVRIGLAGAAALGLIQVLYRLTQSLIR